MNILTAEQEEEQFLQNIANRGKRDVPVTVDEPVIKPIDYKPDIKTSILPNVENEQPKEQKDNKLGLLLILGLVGIIGIISINKK